MFGSGSDLFQGKIARIAANTKTSEKPSFTPKKMIEKAFANTFDAKYASFNIAVDSAIKVEDKSLEFKGNFKGLYEKINDSGPNFKVTADVNTKEIEEDGQYSIEGSGELRFVNQVLYFKISKFLDDYSGSSSGSMQEDLNKWWEIPFDICATEDFCTAQEIVKNDLTASNSDNFKKLVYVGTKNLDDDKTYQYDFEFNNNAIFNSYKKYLTSKVAIEYLQGQLRELQQYITSSLKVTGSIWIDKKSTTLKKVDLKINMAKGLVLDHSGEVDLILNFKKLDEPVNIKVPKDYQPFEFSLLF